MLGKDDVLSGGTYQTPAGLNATLVKNGDGTFKLTFHKSGEQYHFTSAGALTSDTDKNGNALTFSYNGSGQLTQIQDTQQRITTFSYDGNGHITTITDPASRTVKYGYDGGGHLTSSTDLNGKITTFGYSGSDLTTITDPLSNVTTIAYDTSHRATSITDATTAKTSFTYNSGTTLVTDARSHVTTYTYDSQLRVTQVLDALGHTRATTYSPNDDVASYTDGLSQTTNFTFDVNNNISAATDGTGAKTTFGYTDSNHPYYATSTTDPQGNALAYTYDTAGNLTTSQDGLSVQNKVTHTYNTNGTLATTTDADGNQTSYGYDSYGNLTSVTPPSPLGKETLTYDGLSRTTSVTDGKNQKTSFTYDNLDRITLITYADSSTISYTYDVDGNTLTEVDGTGTTTFTYDQVHEELTKVPPTGITITTTYDSVGNLATINEGSGVITYSYDAANNLSSVKEPRGALTTYTYDNNNQRTGISYPTDVSMAITYDAAGHELSIKGTKGTTTLTSFSYSYLKGTTHTGLRYSMTDTSGTTTTYTYDALNRLTSATINGGLPITSTYGYDGAGNRTAYNPNSRLPGNTSYTYNAANELTSYSTSGVSGSTTFTYDANGNETGESRNSTSLLTFAYNAKNQTTGINSDTYTYRGADQNQRTVDDSITASYSGLGLSEEHTSTTTITYIHDNRGGLLAEINNGQEDYYLFDGLGSVVGLTNYAGTLVQTYSYDAFGNGFSTTVVNHFGYAGGYFDQNTGLYKFGLRYYDPRLGRWTQQDPVGGSLFDPGSGECHVQPGLSPYRRTPARRNDRARSYQPGTHAPQPTSTGFAARRRDFNRSRSRLPHAKRVTIKANSTPPTVRAMVVTELFSLCASGKMSLAPI